MRSSLFTIGAASALFIGRSFAENLEAGDVPSACKTICAPIVMLTGICDVDNATLETRCVCTNQSFDVESIGALCASCIEQNGSETDAMDDILETCGFPSTSYAPSKTALVAQVTVSAVKPTATSTETSTGAAAKKPANGISGAAGRSENGIIGVVVVSCLGVALGALLL